MSMTTDEARGARASVFNTLTLICDNNEGAYDALTSVAREVLTAYPDMTLDAYRALRRAGAQSDEQVSQRYDLAGAAGEAVRVEVEEWVEDVSGVPGQLLTDLLDFGDRQLWEEIGWHYLPDADEMNVRDFDGYVGGES
jgi:hypothetical protein